MLPKKECHWPKEHKEVADRYLAGETTYSLAKSLGKSRKRIVQILRSCDIKIRSKAKPKSKYEGVDVDLMKERREQEYSFREISEEFDIPITVVQRLIADGYSWQKKKSSSK